MSMSRSHINVPETHKRSRQVDILWSGKRYSVNINNEQTVKDIVLDLWDTQIGAVHWKGAYSKESMEMLRTIYLSDQKFDCQDGRIVTLKNNSILFNHPQKEFYLKVFHGIL